MPLCNIVDVDSAMAMAFTRARTAPPPFSRAAEIERPLLQAQQQSFLRGLPAIKPFSHCLPMLNY
jgi:hypothetical protein